MSDEALSVAVTGAGGRMGREVIEAAADREGVDVAVAVNRTAVDPVAGVEVAPADRLGELLAAERPDVLVDFTGPESAVAYAAACADAGVPLVTGTTGFDDAQIDDLRGASDAVPVLKASNFARGVAALRRAVREAAAALPGYDVELTETHHNGKRDAPSGTAKSILEDVESVRDDLDRRVHGREGDAPRQAGDIGVRESDRMIVVPQSEQQCQQQGRQCRRRCAQPPRSGHHRKFPALCRHWL